MVMKAGGWTDDALVEPARVDFLLLMMMVMIDHLGDGLRPHRPLAMTDDYDDASSMMVQTTWMPTKILQGHISHVFAF